MAHPNVNASIASFLLKNCKTLQQLQKIHAQTITRGLLSLNPSQILTRILYTFTLLINPPLPSIHYALSIFNQIPNPTTFSYNTIIRAHTLLSSPVPALALFAKMRRLCIPPDSHTFPFALKACAHLRALALCRTLHSQAMKFGFGADIFVRNTFIHVYSIVDSSMFNARQLFDESPQRDVVSYNALIAGFVRVKEMALARKLFDEMPERDGVSWSTLLAGYAQLNRCKEAIDLFDSMLASGSKPDNVALVSTLSSCAQLGALEQGKSIHDYIKQNKIHLDVFLSTGLVDMYAKCGCIGTARDIFESSLDRNLFTWNAIISGLAMHGHSELSLEFFTRMREAGIRPDGVTFLGVLVGCSHSGLVDEARMLFDEMVSVYGVSRELKHYGCMTDLLGRAGLFKEAMEMIEAMPMGGDVFVWGGLLGGCRIHGNVEVAEIAAEHLMVLDPEDGGVYSIMANIYANARKWDDVVKMRRLMSVRGVKASAGCSLIQVDGISHEFVAGERLHPHVDEIYWVLEGIEKQHKVEAY